MEGNGRIGATIKLYLADGTPSGIRVVGKDNWSGVGVECSRKDLARAQQREEFGLTGVYILSDFDDEEDGGLPHIYVGESEDLGERLSNHARKGDDFGWRRLLIFTSSDSSLNKAHSKYLESRLCQLAAATKRSVLRNRNAPKAPNLSDSDRDQAEVFLRELRLVLPILGVSVFEAPVSTATPAEAKFELGGGSVKARGVETAEGFKVFEGAIASGDAQRSVSNATRQTRADLISNGALVKDGDGYRLTQDYVFNSPSLAAAVLTGYSINGRTAWRLSDGTTLKQVQESELVAFGDHASPTS